MYKVALILNIYLFQLERSQDGFSVVADYFGRGVFNKVSSNLLALYNKLSSC